MNAQQKHEQLLTIFNFTVLESYQELKEHFKSPTGFFPDDPDAREFFDKGEKCYVYDPKAKEYKDIPKGSLTQTTLFAETREEAAKTVYHWNRNYFNSL